MDKVNKFTNSECSLYNQIHKGSNCRTVIEKYLSPELKNSPWDAVLKHYKATGEAGVFEKAVREGNGNLPSSNISAKDFYEEDLKQFKPRGLSYIPRGQGTPIAELTQILEQFKRAYIEDKVHIYYIPITKDYQKYYTPDILHTDTSPYALHKKNGSKVFIQPMLTGTRLSNGKHWLIMFVDLRTTPYTVEFYNSCPIVHKEHDVFTKKVADALQQSSKKKVDTHIFRTTHQKDDRSCGTLVSFYIFCRLNGLSPEKIANSDISQHMADQFRKCMFSDIGDDPTFFWNCEKYTISSDFVQENFDTPFSPEDLESIQGELEELDWLKTI